MLKHLPAMWETQVRSPGWEDPLEKEMATHSSTRAWKIPWTEELAGKSRGPPGSDTTERLSPAQQGTGQPSSACPASPPPR